jgi:predicted 2-oxoglutarate/Fe(II)-dependent dioxygenase YbiX
MYNKLVENFLTKEECEVLIEKGVSQGLFDMKSSKIVNGEVYNENISDTKNNKRKGTYFANETLGEPMMRGLTQKIINKVNELKIFNGIEYQGVPKYSFNEYSPGDFLTWHKDSHEIIYGATITLIIQLNDDYDGGDIRYEIDEVEYTVPKKQGSVFIFDSNINHCVNELKTNKRYSMNVWPSKKIKMGLI